MVGRHILEGLNLRRFDLSWVCPNTFLVRPALPMAAVETGDPPLGPEPEGSVTVLRQGVNPLVHQTVLGRVRREPVSIQPADTLPGGDPHAPVRLKQNPIDPEISQSFAPPVTGPSAPVGKD